MFVWFENEKNLNKSSAQAKAEILIDMISLDTDLANPSVLSISHI